MRGAREEEFSEARRRLLECGDCALPRDCGYELKDGAVMTSVSEVPFEMSWKCPNVAVRRTGSRTSRG